MKAIARCYEPRDTPEMHTRSPAKTDRGPAVTAGPLEVVNQRENLANQVRITVARRVSTEFCRAPA